MIFFELDARQWLYKRDLFVTDYLHSFKIIMSPTMATTVLFLV